MVASIWLQLLGSEREAVGSLIAELAAEYGTMPFEPHLTACTIADPTEECLDAVAGYSAGCRDLPVVVRRESITYSPAVPFRAVTIAVENSPVLRTIRETMRALTGANELVEPHISLLYTVDQGHRTVSWPGHEARLREIAAACDKRLSATEFRMGLPILVSPEGDWINIASWRTIRRF